MNSQSNFILQNMHSATVSCMYITYIFYFGRIGKLQRKLRRNIRFIRHTGGSSSFKSDSENSQCSTQTTMKKQETFYYSPEDKSRKLWSSMLEYWKIGYSNGDGDNRISRNNIHTINIHHYIRADDLNIVFCFYFKGASKFKNYKRPYFS